MPTVGQQLGPITAQLGTLTLGVVDAALVSWTLGGIDGWDGSSVRVTQSDRQQDHGVWLAPTYLGDRPLTLTGTISAMSQADLDTAIDQLLAACSLTDTTLVVNDSTPRQATVRRSGKPIIQRITDTLATYSLLMTAADPRRYETTLQQVVTGLPVTSGGLALPATLPWTLSATTTGSVSATNRGTFDTSPVLTLTGPVSQPVISARYADGSLRQLTYYGADLATGESLVIDTDARTVMQGGASRRRYMRFTGGEWPTIPAGQTVVYTLQAAAYNATARLSVAWRSAWI